MNSETPVNRCSPVPFVCSLNPSVSDVLGKDTLSLFELVRIKLHCQSRCVAADFCVCMLVISSVCCRWTVMFPSCLFLLQMSHPFMLQNTYWDTNAVLPSPSVLSSVFTKEVLTPVRLLGGIFVLYPLTKSRSGAVNTATSTRRLADVSVCQLLWRKNGLFTVNSN